MTFFLKDPLGGLRNLKRSRHTDEVHLTDLASGVNEGVLSSLNEGIDNRLMPTTGDEGIAVLRKTLTFEL
jgi:hypothetical protein